MLFLEYNIFHVENSENIRILKFGKKFVAAIPIHISLSRYNPMKILRFKQF